MKQQAYFQNRGLTVAVFAATMALTGCQKIAPNGQSMTMTLLQSGSGKVCTASDVQQSLHDLIIPKVADIASDGSPADKESAIASISLSHDLSTLQGFDKAVNKASCNTTLKITGAGGASNSFSLDYQISPSAEDSNTFVLTANTVDAKAYVKDLIDTALTQAATTHADEAQKAQSDQARAQLLAMLTPRWLIGTWIPAAADATSCSDGQSLSFAPNHVFTNATSTGRWALSADQLHIVGSGSSGSIDATFTVTQADAVSFSAVNSNDANLSWRRCARDEVDPPSASPTSPTPAPPAQAPQ